MSRKAVIRVVRVVRVVRFIRVARVIRVERVIRVKKQIWNKCCMLGLLKTVRQDNGPEGPGDEIFKYHFNMNRTNY